MIRGGVHLKDTSDSFLIDALYDPASTRTLIGKDLVPKILDCPGRHLDRSRRSFIILANCSRGKILAKVELPLTIDGITKKFEVRVAIKLDIEFVLGLDAHSEFDVVLAARSKGFGCQLRTARSIHSILRQLRRKLWWYIIIIE